MDRFFSVIMYLLWTLTILAVLSATFTNFQYEDVNIIAGVLLVFALLNSVLILYKKK